MTNVNPNNSNIPSAMAVYGILRPNKPDNPNDIDIPKNRMVYGILKPEPTQDEYNAGKKGDEQPPIEAYGDVLDIKHGKED